MLYLLYQWSSQTLWPSMHINQRLQVSTISLNSCLPSRLLSCWSIFLLFILLWACCTERHLVCYHSNNVHLVPGNNFPFSISIPWHSRVGRDRAASGICFKFILKRRAKWRSLQSVYARKEAVKWWWFLSIPISFVTYCTFYFISINQLKVKYALYRAIGRKWMGATGCL